MSSGRGPEAKACRVCEGPLRFTVKAREMYHGTREAFDYSTCERCGCLQIDEIPADLGRYYPDDYYTQVAKPVSKSARGASGLRRFWTSARLAAGGLLWPLAGRRFDRFRWFTRTGTGVQASILDVGCGSGKLLWHMHREGFENLKGIDPHLGSSTHVENGPRFECESLEKHEGQYDFVMSHHSFEHVENPRSAFAAFARIVRPGGWLLLRIPLADGWAFRHYGADWVQLDAPRHLHLHTRESVAHLAGEYGFRIANSIDDSDPFQIWGSELYRRDVALVDARKHGRPFLGWRTRVGARLRTLWLRATHRGDQACFYLQRL